MNPSKFLGVAVVGAVLAAGTVSTGCATKRFVRERVDTVDQRVSEVDKKTTEKFGTLEERVDKDVSRLDERVMTVDAKAAEAAREAAKANEAAAQAGQKADGAQQLAQQNTQKVEQLGRKLDNFDNYKMVSSETVLFDFGKWQLTDDAKAKLDQLARNASGTQHYILEVQGFSDPTGPRDYNLMLSEKRADAVVRYMTMQHNIPVHRIHKIGFGEESLAAGTERVSAEQRQRPRRMSREERQQARKVDVKVFAIDFGTLEASTRTTPQ